MNSKKITFIANAPLSSKKISIYQTLCQAQTIGKLSTITLIIPKRSDYINNEDKSKKIKRILNINEDLTFKVINLRYFDLFYLKIIPKKIRFTISSLCFSFNAIKETLKNNSDLILTRDIYTLLLIYLIKKCFQIKQKVIFESHQYSPIRAILINCVDILLVINEYQTKKYNHKNCHIMHDAVWQKDIKCLKKNVVKKSIFYCGSCSSGKGINRLIRLSKILPDYQFNIATIENYTNKNIRQEWKAKNINWLGTLNRKKLEEKIASSEFCILPNDLENLSNKYSSPMKLFEYMSKGKALILSNIPTVTEILKRDEYIELPINLEKSNIKKIIENSNSKLLGNKSFNLIKKFTWENRAKKLMNLIEKIS